MFKNKFSESDEIKMLTYTYVSKGKFELMEKPKPVLMHERDAIGEGTLVQHLFKRLAH